MIDKELGYIKEIIQRQFMSGNAWKEDTKMTVPNALSALENLISYLVDGPKEVIYKGDDHNEVE